MQCSNVVKQLSLSTHNFHDVHNRLPCNGYDPIWTSYKKQSAPTVPIDYTERYNYLTLLLPYIEQTSYYEYLVNYIKTQQSAGATSISNPAGGSDTVFILSIKSFICPSDPNGRIRSTPTTSGNAYDRNNYCACRGDCWQAYNTAGANRGAFSAGNTTTNDFASIIDGTSNTVFISEMLCSPVNNTNLYSDRDSKYVTAVVRGFGSIDYSAASPAYHAPSECLLVRGQNGEVASTYLSRANGGRGSRWPSAFSGYSNFMTALPPNSPSCDETASGNFPEMPGLFSASSQHTGGINAGLGDGSVRFVSETIDTGNQQDTATNPKSNSASIYGVWGALGTREGGESKAL